MNRIRKLGIGAARWAIDTSRRPDWRWHEHDYIRSMACVQWHDTETFEQTLQEKKMPAFPMFWDSRWMYTFEWDGNKYRRVNTVR